MKHYEKDDGIYLVDKNWSMERYIMKIKKDQNIKILEDV